MASKSPSERIGELEVWVAVTNTKLEATARALDEIDDGHSDTRNMLDALRREYEREIALLKREVDDLKKDRERWGQRLWMVRAPLIAGAAGVFLAYQLGVKR